MSESSLRLRLCCKLAVVIDDLKPMFSLKQKELEDALLEAKNAAIARLREQLLLQKRLEYINFMRMEAQIFSHTQQITRAFVFSYYDLLAWLEQSAEA